jgi:diguanylate cyclase (GGDEF)-like protein
MADSRPPRALLLGEASAPAFSACETALRDLGLELQALPLREAELSGALSAPDPLIVMVDPPRGAGQSLIDAARRSPGGSRAPILVLSGAPNRPSDLEWLQAGADIQAPCPPTAAVLSAALSAAERLRRRARESADLEERLRRAATTDPLTGLANHRQFHDRLHEEYLRCERYGASLSILFADLDHFRDINTTYGHKVGDGFLQGVSAFLASAVRKVDLVARYAGEQFALLLPETDAARAMQAAERLRTLTAGFIYKEPAGSGAYHPLIKTTLSFGVATCPHADVRSRHDLVERAQQALLQAQGAGRNRVCQHSSR